MKKLIIVLFFAMSTLISVGQIERDSSDIKSFRAICCEMASLSDSLDLNLKIATCLSEDPVFSSYAQAYLEKSKLICSRQVFLNAELLNLIRKNQDDAKFLKKLEEVWYIYNRPIINEMPVYE